LSIPWPVGHGGSAGAASRAATTTTATDWKGPAPRLLQGIRDAAAGGAFMSPEIVACVIALFRQTRPVPLKDHDLTPHEIRVLKLLVDGHNYKTAAVELGVSVNTISFHMRRIYDKLHVHTKSEAVAKALRNQIVG
jgi:DNA-binding NarL/FixJ family response regulator